MFQWNNNSINGFIIGNKYRVNCDFSLYVNTPYTPITMFVYVDGSNMTGSGYAFGFTNSGLRAGILTVGYQGTATNTSHTISVLVTCSSNMGFDTSDIVKISVDSE